MGVTVKINSDKFAQQLIRVGATSKRSFTQVLNTQVKGFVRIAMTITPPGEPQNANKTKGTPTGYQKGRRAVAGDILHIMRGTSNSRLVQSTEIQRIHTVMRNKRGRVNRDRLPSFGARGIDARPGQKKIIVPAAALRAYIKSKQKRVGHLAAGWNRTARKFGYNPPEWISRHGDANGRVRLNVSRNKILVRSTNAVRYAHDVDGLERRMQVALNMQANNMERQVDDYLRKIAAKAGLKVK